MRRTWKDLAAHCEVSERTVANWRTHRVRPDVDHLLGVADFLGYSDTGKVAERVA